MRTRLFCAVFSITSFATFAMADDTTTMSRADLIRMATMISARIAGVPCRIGSSCLNDMIAALKAGDRLKAADIATKQPGFINLTMTRFIAPIHSTNQTFRTTTNTESSALIKGVVRDNKPITDILTANYFYVINDATCAAKDDPYLCATQNGLDLSSAAMMSMASSRQFYMRSATSKQGPDTDDQGKLKATKLFREPTMEPSEPKVDATSPELAGVFSSQGFGSTTILAGTNRRPIQQAVNQLWCLPLDAIRTRDALDIYVGPDVSRDAENAGLDLYRTKCKTCHSIIDGMRSVFANFDVDAGDAGGRLNYRSDGNSVDKYRRNQGIYPSGYKVTANTWQLMMPSDQLSDFGWSGPTSGKGLQSFGKAFAQSKQFFSCMVTKVIEASCPFDMNNPVGTLALSDTVRGELTDRLQANKNLREIFELVATRPECLGK